MREEMKRKLLDYAYTVFSIRELNQLNDSKFEKFKKNYAYFLPDDEQEIILEYLSHSLFKWVKRLNIIISREDVREYIQEKGIILFQE
jgi:hypothetical protein